MSKKIYRIFYKNGLDPRLRGDDVVEGQSIVSQVFILILALLTTTAASALTVGSNTAVTRAPRAYFPAGATNTLLGFGACDRGVVLGDLTTTCTYNAFFPVSTLLDLSGGQLSLTKDLILSNTTYFINGGTILGNTYSIEIPQASGDFSLLRSGPTTSVFKQLSTAAFSLAPTVVDWNWNNTYIAGGVVSSPGGLLGIGAGSNNELYVFYFSNNTLTTTQAISVGATVNSVAWHPSLDFVGVALATGIGASGTTSAFLMYQLVVSNGSFNQTASVTGGTVTAVAWHTSGSYISVGSSSNIITYSFNSSTGAVTQVQSKAVGAAVQLDALSFSPSGSYLAAGLATGGTNQLVVYPFSAGSLGTINAGVAVGSNVTAVAYSPTGSFIATANGNAGDLVIYLHNAGAGTLTQVAALVLPSIAALSWNTTGKYLSVAYSGNAASGSDVVIFYFDQINYQLIEASGLLDNGNGNVTAGRFSHDGNHLALGDAVPQALVYSVDYDYPLLFNNTNLLLNTNLIITRDVQFGGHCKIMGKGNKITLNSNSPIIIRPGGQLVFEDTNIVGLNNNNLRCMSDNGSVVLRNSNLFLSNNFTLTSGSLLFDGTVVLTGTGTFIYASGLTSTIGSLSTLFVDSGVTFSYAPRNAKNALLFMTDATSALYLNGCTLYSTRTGLLLSGGTLILDDNITLSSSAKNSGEALTLNSNLNIRLKGTAAVNVNGFVKVI